MPAENLELRTLFREGLLSLERDAAGERAGLDAIKLATRRRPGLMPLGEAGALHAVLEHAAGLLPDNLTVRTALAEAKWAGDGAEAKAAARDLFISVIRDARPTDCLPRVGGGEALRGEEMRGMRFQSVDLGADFVDGDPKDARISAREMLMLHWPDLTGKSVLDVGAYSGWYSLEAERRGAARVTANDFYSWMVNYPEMWGWVGREIEAGRAADTYKAPYPALDPEQMPGRLLFDRARETLGSRIELAFGLIDTVEVEPHDVVLLLGVLYHHENPIQLLRRMFDVTRETLVVETLAVACPRIPDTAAWQMFGPRGFSNDGTTVWAPTELGLKEALLKVGFREVELLYGWDTIAPIGDAEAVHFRLWAHARK